MQGYDAFIVQLSVALRGDFSPAAAGLALFAFLIGLPALIGGLVGFKGGDTAESVLGASLDIGELSSTSDAIHNYYYWLA